MTKKNDTGNISVTYIFSAADVKEAVFEHMRKSSHPSGLSVFDKDDYVCEGGYPTLTISNKKGD